MNILALDTSSMACSVALLQGHDIKSRQIVLQKQQAKLILGLIDDLLSSSFIKLNQLDAIAFGCGPGSFTGLRIAASVAQGLAFATQLPVIPISSLAVMAQAAFLEAQQTKSLVALDARQGHVYWARYEVMKQTGCVELIGREEWVIPDKVSLPEGDVSQYCAIGEAWMHYREPLLARVGGQPLTFESTSFKLAEALLPLAKLKANQGEWMAAADALPVYL